MLQDHPRRPWSLKQRILSRHGHLSNDSAADIAEKILSPALKHLFLGHLSRECNLPELALQAVAGRLQKLGGTHVGVELTFQDRPCPTFSL
jgi:phosphoribosyl 1,2-cyclic phosphodiesterase